MTAASAITDFSPHVSRAGRFPPLSAAISGDQGAGHRPRPCRAGRRMRDARSPAPLRRARPGLRGRARHRSPRKSALCPTQARRRAAAAPIRGHAGCHCAVRTAGTASWRQFCRTSASGAAGPPPAEPRGTAALLSRNPPARPPAGPPACALSERRRGANGRVGPTPRGRFAARQRIGIRGNNPPRLSSFEKHLMSPMGVSPNDNATYKRISPPFRLI